MVHAFPGTRRGSLQQLQACFSQRPSNHHAKGGRLFEATRRPRAAPGCKVWTLNHTVSMCKYGPSLGITVFDGRLARTAGGKSHRNFLAASQCAYAKPSPVQIHTRPQIYSTNAQMHPNACSEILLFASPHILYMPYPTRRITLQDAAPLPRTVSKTKGHPFLNDPSSTSKIQSGPPPAAA